MKKAILIVAIILVALVGLTSYNSNEQKKESNGDDRLLAVIKTSTKGEPVISIGGGKKQD